ncbi:MAG TPA: hypothetical protein VFD36_10110, partial [Kofleriaceae bacterium]|nr:hypothetical protein [Kofleriaceae bacterium]
MVVVVMVCSFPAAWQQKRKRLSIALAERASPVDPQGADDRFIVGNAPVSASLRRAWPRGIAAGTTRRAQHEHRHEPSKHAHPDSLHQRENIKQPTCHHNLMISLSATLRASEIEYEKRN